LIGMMCYIDGHAVATSALALSVRHSSASRREVHQVDCLHCPRAHLGISPIECWLATACSYKSSERLSRSGAIRMCCVICQQTTQTLPLLALAGIKGNA
jgi:hypothetical protein